MEELDVEAAPGPSDDALRLVSTLAQRQLEQEKAVADATEALVKANEALKITKETDLPNAMSAAGQELCKVTGGYIVTLKTIVRGHIPEERRPQAHIYLRGRGDGALIKTEITAYFGKGEEQQAAHLLDVLREDFPKQEVKTKEAVNAQTLSAFVREQLKKQAPIDEVMLGVTRQRLTEITAPKQKSVKADEVEF